MGRLRRFAALEPARRRLLIRSWFVVGAARLALWTIPYPRLRRMLDGRARRLGAVQNRTPADTAQSIAWAVTVASDYFPRSATCLPRALAVEYLMVGAGLPATVRFGVARDGADPLRAHAWVESDGRVVIGGANLDEYTPLLEKR